MSSATRSLFKQPVMILPDRTRKIHFFAASILALVMLVLWGATWRGTTSIRRFAAPTR